MRSARVPAEENQQIGLSTPQRSTKRGLWTTAVLALLLLAAGCGNSGAPTAYDITVQTNYINACSEQAERDRIVRRAEDFEGVCGCAYARISAPNGGIPFEQFRELDDKVRGNPSQINEDETGLLIRQILTECMASAAEVG